MSHTLQIQAAWYAAHDAVRAYLQPFASVPLGRSLASQACGLWVRKAADGETMSSCPYAGLFEAAAHALIHLPSMPCDVDEHVLIHAIPLDNSMLPYQMSKIYVDVWKAGQLLGWEKKLINRASNYVTASWPVNPTCYATFDPNGIGPLAEPLARRAVETLDQHQCLDCTICTDASERWEDSDKATEQWFTAQRLQRKE